MHICTYELIIHEIFHFSLPDKDNWSPILTKQHAVHFKTTSMSKFQEKKKTFKELYNIAIPS